MSYPYSIGRTLSEPTRQGRLRQFVSELCLYSVASILLSTDALLRWLAAKYAKCPVKPLPMQSFPRTAELSKKPQNVAELCRFVFVLFLFSSKCMCKYEILSCCCAWKLIAKELIYVIVIDACFANQIQEMHAKATVVCSYNF